MSAYTVNSAWRVLLSDLQVNPANVLRRAELPHDLFAREKSALTTDEWFALWHGIAAESGDAALPLTIGATISVESFDPPVFAALCSPDLNTALQRLAHYKRLIMPMKLHVDIEAESTSLKLHWLETVQTPPAALVATELVFFVQLARIATRMEIRPSQVTMPDPIEPMDEYRRFFGTNIKRNTPPTLVFRAADAARPFLTANEPMWQFFEPDLRRRLSDLEAKATAAERARAALLELLPAGAAAMGEVARKLGLSPRTLQRKLKKEGKSFQALLNTTREELARHYLKSPQLSGAEISFLLGYDDPNSFFRAFHSWTGTTPEQARSAMFARVC